MSDPAQPVPLSLLPSGIRDARQEALTSIMGRALGELDVASLVMTDPMTVDAKLLPFLVCEYSAQNLIQPDFPEHVQRRLLKNIWEIKSLTGYDAGVKLGLELLGMAVQIEHWHQVEPKRTPNTHTITSYVGEQIFKDNQVILNDRVQAAALRVIEATKRQSQETELRIGAGFTGEVSVANGMARSQLHHAAFDAGRNGSMCAEISMSNAYATCELHRHHITVDRNSHLQSGVQFANQIAGAQIGRFSCACAP